MTNPTFTIPVPHHTKTFGRYVFTVLTNEADKDMLTRSGIVLLMGTRLGEADRQGLFDDLTTLALISGTAKMGSATYSFTREVEPGSLITVDYNEYREWVQVTWNGKLVLSNGRDGERNFVKPGKWLEDLGEYVEAARHIEGVLAEHDHNDTIEFYRRFI